MAKNTRIGLGISCLLALGASACTGSRSTAFPEAGCAIQAPLPSAGDGKTEAGNLVESPHLQVTGSWLWSCCDAKETWIGMLVLVQTGGELHGAFLTDGDSHASYLDGRIDGRLIHLARRWHTGAVLHEQFYELTLDADGQRLTGTFTEPAFDPVPHTIHIARGFTSTPRLPLARPETTPKPGQDPIEGILGEDAERDPKRPCDCDLVCYCGGIPPGPEHYRESSRCGGSCKCRACPPIP